MPTLRYKQQVVPDFVALVDQPLDLKSPTRSTVPLLAYWDAPASRLGEYLNTLGVEAPDRATLTFEYTCSPTSGVGKASHTDLMIEAPALAVGTEAKYTEPPYELVSSWLGDPVPENRRLVLNSWLEAINRASGCSLTLDQVPSCTYQLIHRTASVCSVVADARLVVYHCFDPLDEHVEYYSSQLQQIATLLKGSSSIGFILYLTTLSKSEAYAELQRERLVNPRLDYSSQVRALLKRHDVSTFGDPVVMEFS